MARDEDRQRGAVSVEGANGSGLPGAIADLSLMVGGLSKQMAAPVAPRVPYEVCHDVWLPGQIPLTSGTGTLDHADLYGPKDPYVWDVRTISIWGFTAGTVAIYLNDPTNGEPIGEATTIGQFTWSSQILMHARDRLIFTGSSITGTVNVAVRAIEVHGAWLAEYLM